MAAHAHLPLRPSPCPLQVVDGYFVKYGASCVALLVYAVPIYMRDPRLRGSQDDITQDYVRAMRLLQNTSRCAWHTAAPLLRVRVFSRLRRACRQHPAPATAGPRERTECGEMEFHPCMPFSPWLCTCSGARWVPANLLQQGNAAESR